MDHSDTASHQKGHYLGTEINEQWWKRYKKNKFFARGTGEYWFDDTAFYFRRYLTKQPLTIPFEKVSAVKIGKSHAGRGLSGNRVVKLIWEKDQLSLSSGFVLSGSEKETAVLALELKGRL